MVNVALGIGIMLASTSIMNIGTVLQKKGVDSLPPMEQTSAKNNIKGVVTSKIWVLGWIMTSLAMLLNMIALGQADITIIQPLIGFGLVVLVLFSRWYLKEKISKSGIIGISVAIIGVILLGLTASESQDLGTVDEIVAKYVQINAIIIYAIFVSVIAILWITVKRMQYKGAGIIFALIAAMFSVLGLTFSKGVFSIIDEVGFIDALKLWQAYLLLVLFITGSTMAIATQTMSLQKGKAVVVTPVFNLSSIILPLSTGFMVFGEIISPIKIIATIIILVGAILLSIKK